MAKTQEELNSLKAELEALNNKVKELDEEELENVAAGMITFDPLKELLQKVDTTKYNLLKKGILEDANINRLTYHRDFFNQFCKKYNIDPEELLEYINNKKAEQSQDDLL